MTLPGNAETSQDVGRLKDIIRELEAEVMLLKDQNTTLLKQNSVSGVSGYNQ